MMYINDVTTHDDWSISTMNIVGVTVVSEVESLIVTNTAPVLI